MKRFGTWLNGCLTIALLAGMASPAWAGGGFSIGFGGGGGGISFRPGGHGGHHHGGGFGISVPVHRPRPSVPSGGYYPKYPSYPSGPIVHQPPPNVSPTRPKPPVGPIVGTKPTNPTKPIGPVVGPVKPLPAPKPAEPAKPITLPIGPVQPKFPKPDVDNLVGPVKPKFPPLGPIGPLAPNPPDADPPAGDSEECVPPPCPPPCTEPAFPWWVDLVNVGVGYGGGCSTVVVPEPVVVYIPPPSADIAAEKEPDALPKLPLGVPFEIPGEGFGKEQGLVLIKLSEVSLTCTVNEWNDDSIEANLPALGITKPLTAELSVVTPDGKVMLEAAVEIVPVEEKVVQK